MNNFKDIQNALEIWKKERHLEDKGQLEGYAANMTEELSELLRALTSNDEHLIIDALCDMVVFSLNLNILDKAYLNLLDYNIRDEKLVVNYDEKYFKIVDSTTMLIRIAHRIKYNDMQCKDILIVHVSDLLDAIVKQIMSLGYCPYKVMEETIKEINDRTGHYDDNIKKFVKDKKDTYYKADYSKCKH